MKILGAFLIWCISSTTIPSAAAATNPSPTILLHERLDRLEHRVDSLIYQADPSGQDNLTSVCDEIASLRGALCLFSSPVQNSAGSDSLLASLIAVIEEVKIENRALRAQITSQQYASADPDAEFAVTSGQRSFPQGIQPDTNTVSVNHAGGIDGLHFSGIFDAAGSFDNNSRRTDFTLNQVEGDLEQIFSKHVSFRADVELNSRDASGYEIALEQGYVTFALTRTGRLHLTVGRFNSPIGFEQSDPAGSYLYTRGFIYTHALPSDLTGLMTTIQLNRRWNFTLFGVNGWDQNSDNNMRKSLGLETSYLIGKKVSLGLSILTGPEQNENNSSVRGIIDGTATINLTESDYTTLELNHGSETKALLNGGTARWTGAMLAGHYTLRGALSLSVRLDHFRDRDGNRTGVAQNLTEFAIAPTWSVPDGPDLVLELRQNWSNRPNFGATADKNTQFDLALEVTLGF